MPKAKASTRSKKVAKILSPAKGAAFCYDEVINFTAEAFEIDKDGNRTNISQDIEWRRPAKGTGPKFRLSFDTRQNTTIAIYLNQVRKDSISVQISCCPYDGTSYSADEKLLARIMLGEGETCVAEERRALGYAVINRLRFRPDVFGSTLSKVINQPSQFGGINTKIYGALGSEQSIKELVHSECVLYQETLKIAKAILADSGSANEPLFRETGKHAFTFNQASNDPPTNTQLIKSKDQSGWRHSFYTYVG